MSRWRFDDAMKIALLGSGRPTWATNDGARPRQKILSLGMPGVMLFHAFGKKTLPAALTAARQSRTATLGAHAGAESVLTLAGAFRGLKSAFHR
jgi:hypothetical protein